MVDVVRYVAAGRRALKGPLALEIEGPGDPLASPETVLRALSILREHHPDVVTGLVVDGPLMAEYAEELEAFGLQYLVLRVDAATPRTAQRLVDGALYRGDRLDRVQAATLMLDETPRAMALAARHGIPVAVRYTLVPTVNARDAEGIARLAAEGGARRLDVVSHRPHPASPLARAGVPTPGELAEARDRIGAIFHPLPHDDPVHDALDWMSPDRLQSVDLDALDAVDVLRTLPGPEEDQPVARVLPPRRALLVAVATTDGVLVDLPLNTTQVLHIYAVAEDRIRVVGVRPLPLDPRRRHDGVGDAQTFLQALVGCRALVATRIPARAQTLLDAVGIRATAHGGPLEEVLDRVSRGTLIRS